MSIVPIISDEPTTLASGPATIIISFLLSFRFFVDASGSYRFTHLFAAVDTQRNELKGLQLFFGLEQNNMFFFLSSNLV